MHSKGAICSSPCLLCNRTWISQCTSSGLVHAHKSESLALGIPFLACLGFRNICCCWILRLDQISTDCLSTEPLVVSMEEDDVETSHTTAEASQHQYRSCERDTLLGSESKTPHWRRNIRVTSPKQHNLSDLLPRDTPENRVQTTVRHYQFGSRQILLYLRLA